MSRHHQGMIPNDKMLEVMNHFSDACRDGRARKMGYTTWRNLRKMINDPENLGGIWKVDWSSYMNFKGEAQMSLHLITPNGACDFNFDTDDWECDEGDFIDYFFATYNSLNYENTKENKTMNFNFDFGPCTNNDIKLSMYGIAVKNANGTYVAYDKTKGDIIDVDIFSFEGGKYCYKIPVAVNDVKVGDVIIHNRKPLVVVGNDGDIIAVDVAAGEKKTVLPTKNVFNFNFITKVVSIVDSLGGTPTTDNPFGNMLPLFLLNDGNMDNDALIMMALCGGGSMDAITKNPMMFYLLMGKDGKMNDMLLPLMMMNGGLGALAPANGKTENRK